MPKNKNYDNKFDSDENNVPYSTSRWDDLDQVSNQVSNQVTGQAPETKKTEAVKSKPAPSKGSFLPLE